MHPTLHVSTPVLYIFSPRSERKETREYRNEEAKACGEGGAIVIMHGRSRMDIDPRVPTMPGREGGGCSPTRQTLHQAQKRREAIGGSHEG